MSKRIGFRMEMAVSYVARHPGCAVLPVSCAIGPHGSPRFGHRSVWRAIHAGLITAVKKPSGRYSLTAVAS